MQPDRKIWFPAKKYGWGWGLPCAWQGWVVLIAWLVILFFGITIFFQPNRKPVSFFLFEVVMVGVLITICWWKGEKPKWRWGNK
jgi:lipoprotein signal peptidase